MLRWVGGRQKRRHDDHVETARLLRVVAYFNVQGWAKNPPDPEQLWPLPGDDNDLQEPRKATEADMMALFAMLGGEFAATNTN
jgi:hypothetical protein